MDSSDWNWLNLTNYFKEGREKMCYGQFGGRYVLPKLKEKDFKNNFLHYLDNVLYFIGGIL